MAAFVTIRATPIAIALSVTIDRSLLVLKRDADEGLEDVDENLDGPSEREPGAFIHNRFVRCDATVR